jgi:streptogramin lyase
LLPESPRNRRRSPSTSRAAACTPPIRITAASAFDVDDGAGATRLWEAKAGGRPRSVAVAPDGSVWVANDESATVTLHEPAAGAIVHSLNFHPGARPSGLALSPDGARAYLSLQGSGELVELDVAAACRGRDARRRPYAPRDCSIGRRQPDLVSRPFRPQITPKYA